jgi:hypothetical protein
VMQEGSTWMANHKRKYRESLHGLGASAQKNEFWNGANVSQNHPEKHVLYIRNHCICSNINYHEFKTTV